jgi:hypothetical protein
MYPIAYLHCERCQERRLFVSYAETREAIDPNLAACSECGFEFGYKLTELPPEKGGGVHPRPVLDPEVLHAGMTAWRLEYAERLRQTGHTAERMQAQAKLDAALASDDMAERQRLTHPGGRTGLTAEQAARVLQPTIGNRRGGGGVDGA